LSEYIVDIETNGLAWNSLLHCVGIKKVGEVNPIECYTRYYLSNSSGNLPTVKNMITSSDIMIGFNNVSFDGPVLETIWDTDMPKQLDLMILAKLCYSKDTLFNIDRGIKDMPPKLWGTYSLKAFGYRLGMHKDTHEDWTRLSSEMVDYCKQDVLVTEALYIHLKSLKTYPPDSVIELEHKVARILAEQQRDGFYFDIDKAAKFDREMRFKKLTLEHQLAKVFKPLFLSGKNIEATKLRRQRTYTKDLTFKGWYI